MRVKSKHFNAIGAAAAIIRLMAAAPDLAAPELVDLKTLRTDDLEPLLEEERLAWRSLLRWDFNPSADLVRRFIRIQALNGYALLIGGRVAGYSYFVCEERKGLIGDLFLRREHASTENEYHLLSAVVDELVRTPTVQRVEAQLMMLHGPFDRPMPLAAFVHVFPRNFMIADLDGVDQLGTGRAASALRIAPWSEHRHEEAALLIASSYQGHVDSSINDQYRSYAGAKRFLTNIVQYPGCGSFFGAGSFLAEGADGHLCGIVLSSLVATDVGHITQICVSPEWKGRGVGYELMRTSLSALLQEGCEKVSLTVTASNTSAIQLYQRMGFRATRRFAAYVWDGF